VRVVRGPPEQPAGVCLDHGGPLELSLGTGPTSRGRVQVLLIAFDSPLGGPLPASRCAGPLPSDLAPALPIATVRRSDLRRRDVKLDFSGRRPFAAGAFSGEIASTFVIRARVTHTSTRARRGSLPVGVPPPTRLRRVADLRLRYRATPRPEPLSLAFRAGGPPRCESLDACALAGTVALTMTKPVDLEIGATVPLARGRKATLAAALAGLRAGRASLFVAPRGEPAGQAVYELTRDGAAWCHDARALELPELVAEARGKRLALGLGGPQLAEAEDPLRSRCPGPASSPERDGALASGTIDLARLGERQLGVRLGGRAVRDPDFTVTPSGGLVLDLERTRQTVRAQSIRVPR
jgi:hypothetical protein